MRVSFLLFFIALFFTINNTYIVSKEINPENYRNEIYNMILQSQEFVKLNNRYYLPEKKWALSNDKTNFMITKSSKSNQFEVRLKYLGKVKLHNLNINSFEHSYLLQFKNNKWVILTSKVL